MEANLLQHPLSSSIFLLHAFLCFLLLSRPCISSSNRQTLQIGIGIGIGGGTTPPSPEPEPICPPLPLLRVHPHHRRNLGHHHFHQHPLLQNRVS
ncbi:hypothetical protein IEQ34_004871 [Dendrobium chrysotoxum]|uniref:Uncharacterized protein n=1 Tax=Dendrobium chrysotoxum TaxID=161865 RepID=A0AAV7HB12_DENCH|nr:hypothetical protein IEQ34_004871 [Dendrobium chrysotoxum]